MSFDIQTEEFGRYISLSPEPTDGLARVRWVIPTDDDFGDQWHLLNTGQDGGLVGFDLNVVGVWDDYTGAGVLVGIVDDGVSYTHPDLDDNYDTSLDRDGPEGDDDAFPTFGGALNGDNHGTAVAGVVAGENNGIYGVGVAYDATLVGLRIGYTSSDGPEQPAAHFNYAVTAGIDILNNSWGYGGFFSDTDDFNDPFFADLAAGLQNAADNGRDGLGTLVFFSSGNDGDNGQDTNAHNLANSRYIFTIGATNRDGYLTDFSTPGASVLVVAPGEEILTTDREEAASGRNNRGYVLGSYTTVIDGTSFSSPAAAGVAALALEANPDLGWRDMQKIYAMSAIQPPTGNFTMAGASIDPGWQFNGAEDWNGGGMHTSRWYGFGMLDAHNVVRFAETWTDQSTSANEMSVSGTNNTSKTVADLSTVTSTITLGSGVDIGNVEVALNLSHTAPVDLIVTLISPDGTESILVYQPGVIPGTDASDADDIGGDGVPSADIVFTLSSNEFMGETGEGTWTLKIQDTLEQDSGQLNSWTLTIYGNELTDDDTYFFTDEFTTFAAQDASRKTLSDSLGINTINSAPVTTDQVIDLSGVSTSTIAETTVTLVGTFHNVFTGDGNDTISGNALDNHLFGGRGDDTIDGADGSDTVEFLTNVDQFTVTVLTQTSVEIAYTGASGIDEGTDVISNVEFFDFNGNILTLAEVIVLGGGSINEVPVFSSGTTANFAENGTGVAYDADATDADSAAPTYAITGGADSALFTINSATGEVSFVTAPDFEAPADSGGDNVYDIEVTASSAGDDTSQNVAITVTNENDNAPSFTSGTTANFAENGTGTAYDANATDADGTNPTFAITGGADAALFSINSATGEVTFDSAPDFEAPADSGGDNVYDIEITASDGDNDTAQNVAITVTNETTPPTFSSGTTANFAENGVGVAYDADASTTEGPAPTYAITGGADSALFTINSATGEVSFVTSPDFEAPADGGGDNVYNIEVTATSDGESTPQNVAITVTNENDNAPVFTSGTSANFAEGGTGVAYDANATDADGTSPTFAITGGADSALFTINSATGEVSFAAAPDFEAPGDSGGDNVYNIEVTASDGTNDTPQNIAITVTDVSGPPVFESGTTASVEENDAGVVYDANASAADGPAPTYAITGGADSALFTINSATGEVSFAAAPDFEAPADSGGDNDYEIIITANSGGQTASQSVTISVTNTNDLSPVFTSGTTANFAENGTGVAYDANATDGDGTSPTFSITGGADSALFTINSATGEVSFVSSPDFETPGDAGGNNVYDIEVTASDGTNDTVQNVAITVTDVGSEFNVINGDGGDNDLEGTAGADQINGLGGADVINGGGGIDELNGGDGDDIFLVGLGDGPDDFFGGSGTDTIAAIDPGTVISFAHGFGAANSIELITNDDPTAVPEFTIITGTSGQNTIDVSDQSTPHQLEGLAGDDTLIGGSAGDIIIGGTGRDDMRGNGGSDRFVLANGSGTDTIRDFTPGTDLIDVSGVSGVTTFSQVLAGARERAGITTINLPNGVSIKLVGVSIASLSASDFVFAGAGPTAARAAEVSGVTIGGTEGADVFDFSGTDLVGIDAINTGAGNDSVEGSQGNDTIDTGADTDTIVLNGNRADYTAAQIDGDSLTLTDNVGSDGADTIHNAEFFQFADETVSFEQLLGLNEVPEFTSGTTANFAENGGGVAYDADATDADSAAPTYAITGGADSALFTINSATGEVSFVTPPDFEAPADSGGDNQYVIEVTASSDGDDTAQTVTITVTNENDNSPVFTSGGTANFAEGGTGVAYDANATDADGTSPTFAITGGADSALFTINSATGEVSFVTSPDFETPTDNGGDNVYDIEVTASDGTNDTAQNVAITVTDVSGPPTFSSGSSANFAENGTGVVYDANASAADGPAPTYAITGGADSALFTINSATGEVSFAAAPDFEAPADSGGDNDYDIVITADSDGLTASQSVTISVTNANDLSPVFTSGTTANFAENGTGVAYDANATDGDGTSPTFSITGGADSALFTINSATGEVRFASAPNFEAPGDVGGDNVYNIEVTASDGVNNTAQSVAITVTDVEESPYQILDGTPGIDTLDASGETDAFIISGFASNDTLIGGSGDDIILGGTGRDFMTGNAGADTFVLEMTAGIDVITDFTPGEDKIQVAFDQEDFDSFGELLAAATERRGDAIINLPDGSSVKLSGISLSDLDADDFIFGSGTWGPNSNASPTALVGETDLGSGKFGGATTGELVISHHVSLPTIDSDGPLSILKPVELIGQWELGNRADLPHFDLDITHWGDNDYLL